MYTIEVDMTKKLVSVEVKGIFTTDEIRAYIKETKEIMKSFGTAEALILFAYSRMDPVTQENLLLLVNGLREEAEHIKKIAKVEGKVVTRMQMRRLITEVNKKSWREIAVREFNNCKDAMDYLMS